MQFLIENHVKFDTKYILDLFNDTNDATDLRNYYFQSLHLKYSLFFTNTFYR